MPNPGTKVVVGDGPQLAELKARFPDVRFVGAKHGEDLARHYAAADVFVFPSRTDTFGLVMLEALACGVPVAAYPVTGPIDVLDGSGVGILDEDLSKCGVERALTIPAEDCRAFALKYAWPVSAGSSSSATCTPIQSCPAEGGVISATAGRIVGQALLSRPIGVLLARLASRPPPR